MKALTTSEVQAVSGAHSHSYYFLILELPHLFMGFVEFVNYFAELSKNGCQNVDEDDHFTQFFCNYAG